MKKNIFWVLTGLMSVSILDRLTKNWALSFCQEPYAVGTWFRCELVMNRGVSFGLLQSDEAWLFWLVSAGVMLLTLLVGYHALTRARQGLSYYGELLIVVGSCSNLLDRVLYQGVIDFLVMETPWGTWPAYNIADALIVCGVGYLVITQFIESN